jgi:putative FmdB family regulatory protein
MPLYEYRCERCGDVFEVLQKFSDQPLTTHEACGGTVERLISPPAFNFKGTGWYVTDYARKGNGTSSESKAKGENGSKKSDESAGKTTKPESKPAATTTTSSSSDKK